MESDTRERYHKMKNILNSSINGSKLETTLDEFIENIFLDKQNGNWKEIQQTKIDVKCGNCKIIYQTTFKNFKVGKHKVCRMCARKKIGEKRRLSLSELKKRISNKGGILISSQYEGESSPITVRCKCGVEHTTTYANIRNSSDRFRCPNCISEDMRDAYKYKYEDLQDRLIEIGAKLLTKEEDYKNFKTDIDMLAVCGHKHTATLDSFFNSMHKMCPECTYKMNSRENTYNWKGGIYDGENAKFRKTYEFKEWVKAIYKRDGYTCKICDKTNCQLNAHHLDGYNWCIDKRTDIDNGITLCYECHNSFHSCYGYGDNTKEQFEEYIILE